MPTLNCEIEKLTLLQTSLYLRAYLKCSDEIQAEICGLIEILRDPNTDEDDRDMTLITLSDALQTSIQTKVEKTNPFNGISTGNPRVKADPKKSDDSNQANHKIQNA